MGAAWFADPAHRGAATLEHRESPLLSPNPSESPARAHGRLRRALPTGVGLLASAVLLAVYAQGGWAWPLGFVALLPWLWSLQQQRSWLGTLLSAWAMALAYTTAVFVWFGAAIGGYTQTSTATGMAVLLVAAPLFQPQILAFALVRRCVAPRFGWGWAAAAAASAWVGTEWAWPKLLGDTLGHGLYPATALRQAAALVGTAGLTLVLLLTNEALLALWCRRRMARTARAWMPPLLGAALGPAVLWTYATLAPAPSTEGPLLRMGLVQANWVDVERQRRERGSYEVVREVLDTHFAMSYDAVERQKVDAVLWSETTYPTTFGQPKSEAGAEFDREIVGIVNAAQVPFVFGTYDRDSAGEYNAAAFVQPGQGLLGMYRKTRPFPLTEHVPAWLDGPRLRSALPWLGSWQPGQGARVFPLRLAGGREIPVQPLICLDDVDTRLALQGARLGAQALLTMSNDAWFTQHPQGARLHQTVAAFRSIETGLPQFRVTTNGYSALIDASGRVVAGSRMGERTLVVGALPVPVPVPTPLVRWGDWVGPTALCFLGVLALVGGARALPAGRWLTGFVPSPEGALGGAKGPLKVALLPPAARWLTGALRAGARLGLLWMGWAVLTDEALRVNTLAQIRTFTTVFLVPEMLAWLLMRAYAAKAGREGHELVFVQGARRLALPLADVAAVQAWRWPWPSPGVVLRLRSGARWPLGVALPHPLAMARLLAVPMSADMNPPGDGLPSRMAAYGRARQAIWRSRLAHPALQFVLLPLLLALPAFHLHQHIAYGSAIGEYLSFGLRAYLSTLLLWWAAWAIGVSLWGAALRVATELGSLLGALVQPQAALPVRQGLEALRLAAMFVGLPLWLLVRVLGA